MQKLLQDMNIGQNIQKIRNDKKITQVELVAQMQTEGSKISETMLSKIEGGYRNIKVSDLVILKTILGVSYDDFFKDLQIK